MPQFIFTSPQGVKYSVSGPAGATQEQAFQMLQQHMAAAQAQPAAPQQVANPNMGGTNFGLTPAAAASGWGGGTVHTPGGGNFPQIPNSVSAGGFLHNLGGMVNDVGQAAQGVARGAVNGAEQATDDTLDISPQDLTEHPDYSMSQLVALSQQRKSAQIAQMDQRFGLGTPDGSVAQMAGQLASPGPGGAVPENALVGATQALDTAAGQLQNAAPGKTVGQALRSPALQRVESSVGRLPGGAPIWDAISGQVHALGGRVSDLIDSLRGSWGADAEDAGNMLKGSLTKAMANIKAVAGAPFDKIADMIPSTTKVAPTHTFNTLEELTATPQDGTHMGQALPEPAARPMLVRMYEALKQDMAGTSPGGLAGADGRPLSTGNGHVPLASLRSWKKQLGQTIDWTAGDAVNGALKHVYNAVNQDIMDGARLVNPKLAGAIDSANASYKVAKAQMENLGRVVDKNGGTDTIFNSLMNTTKGGSIPLRRVLVHLGESDRQVLAASMLRRLGTEAGSAATTANGAQFSASSFLTNWSNMNADAREALFGRLPEQYADKVTQLAKNVAELKSYTGVLPNAPNTAGAWMRAGALGAVLDSLVHADWRSAATIAGGAAANFGLARVMTNPEAVGKLVETSADALRQARKAAATASVASRLAMPTNTPQQ